MDSYRLEQLRASDNGHFGTILIVDDEPTYSYALVEILRTDGYKVQLVTSGDEALDVMNELSPDLLLVDIRLGRFTDHRRQRPHNAGGSCIRI